MTRNRKDHRQALVRLSVTLAEDVLNASDEEFIAELLKEGRNPTDEAQAMRGLIERAARDCGKARLAAAKAAISAERQGPPPGKAASDPKAARRQLASLLARNSIRSLSMAARNESEMSDADVIGMLADLEELGIVPDDDEGTDFET
jgi:hypothetical protein